MILSIEWLNDFTNITLPPDDLADLLTNAGLESDVVLEGKALNIDITPNRPDCMSHLGVAREIALLTGENLKKPKTDFQESSHSVSHSIAVEIEDPLTCPRYACRVVRNVEVGVSPDWIKDRLEMVGLRTINSVVDVSNYVLMELGHPLHTFDLDRIAGGKIVVRSARKGETLTTLDGERRALNKEHLLICDTDDPVALAGIMGGENSEVSQDTKDVLVESAYFDPVTVRRGARSLGLRTEASSRFERGTDYEGLMMALDRTADLLAQLTGGEILKGVVDEYPSKMTPPVIHFRLEECSAVAGIDFEPHFVRKTFEGLEISLSDSPGGYECKIPTFRPDLQRTIDLTEELARIYGYDRITPDLSYRGWLGIDVRDPMADVMKLKRHFAGLGFNETVTNSLLSPNQTKEFFAERTVELQNPLSTEMSLLRSSLFPGMLTSVAFNIRRGEEDLAFFEHGDTFTEDKSSRTGCNEREAFAGVICGQKRPKQWRRKSEKNDFFALKGYVESLRRFLRLDKFHFLPLADNSIFSVAQVLATGDSEPICEFGLFHRSLLDRFDIDSEVGGFTLALDTIRKIMARPLEYADVPKHPGISRDLSFVVRKNISSGEMESMLRESGTERLKRVSVYDLYEGDQVEEGHKSLTFNLFFRETDRTLTDKEVDAIISTIISKASKDLNAKLR